MDLFGRLGTPDILRILIPSLHRATILPSRLNPPSDVEVILNSIVILQIRFPSSKTAGAPLITFVKPITFKMKNFAELGVRLFDCLDENHFRHPNIEDKDAKLFSTDEVYREMRLKILWPGYSEYPFTRRINIRKGEMTRISMLFNVATAIADFVKKVQSDRDCTCERGLEMWKLTGRESLNVDQFILTGLVHRGGPNWQPEIWCPTFT
ncbi:hypothetical protein HHX47_DHR7000173 [Lentinula edodes]|nr:hypothetical protein HHX47_DHR7000173 [Lentinula edodes]